MKHKILYRMPNESSLQFIKRVNKLKPGLISILLTGFSDTEVVINALNTGLVYRYIMEPWDADDLKQTLDSAIEKYELRKQNEELLQQLVEKNDELLKANQQLNNINNELKENQINLKSYNNELIATTSALEESNEQLTEALKRADESDKLKQAFLQNMSHEIRTPMNGIIGFADMLKSNEVSDFKQKYYVDIIVKSSNQLLSIVDDILEYSMLEAGLISVKKTKTHINTLLYNMLDVYLPEANIKNLELIFENQYKTDDFYAEVDGMKITKIFNSLLNNAIKFTSEGTIKFGFKKQENKLIFYVSDTGIGVKRSEQSKIFERFYQSDSSSTRSYGGTGLGLAICKGFLDIMEGKIWLVSKEAKGATFYFAVPVDTSNISLNITKAEIHKVENAKILVVEDEDVNYLYIDEILRKNKFNSVRAKNGKQAIEYCKQNNDIELVIMDIKIPEMNGYEATRRIKQMRENLTIIAHTAYAATEDKIKAFEAGCDEHIAKPAKPNQLIKLINKYLNSN